MQPSRPAVAVSKQSTMPEGTRSKATPSKGPPRAVLALLGALVLLVGGSIGLVVAAMRQGAGKTAGAGGAPGGPGTASAGGVQTSAQAATEALETAEKAFREGDDQRAVTLLSRAAAEHPTDQRVRVLYAQVLSVLKRADEAYAQAEAAVAVGPGEVAPLQALAGTLAHQAGRFDRAVEHFASAQRLEPTEPRHPLYLAMAQVRAGDTTAAQASLLRVIKMNDAIAEAWGTLAELQLAEGSAEAAAGQAKRACELQPGVTKWTVVHARALKRLARPEEAAALLTALSPAERATGPVLRALEECFGLLSRPRDAAEAYAAAAELAENQPPPNDAAAYRAKAAEWFRRAGDEAAAKRYGG